MLDIMNKLIDFTEKNGLYIGLLAFIVILFASNAVIDAHFNKK